MSAKKEHANKPTEEASVDAYVHDRWGGSHTATSERELREIVKLLLEQLGTEEFFGPDLEHAEFSVTQANENTISVHLRGWITLDTPEDSGHLCNLPFEELEEMLVALGTGDLDTVLNHEWKDDRSDLALSSHPFYLYALRPDMTDLHRAAALGDVSWATAEIQSGADLNARNKAGMTPLHRACGAAQFEMCKCLLDSGADVNAGDSNGETPLDYAELGGEMDRTGKIVAKIKKLLLKLGGEYGNQ